MTGKNGEHLECVEAGILENALVMMLVLDEKGTIFGWNHAAETITGYTKDSVIGNSGVWKYLYPDADYRMSVTKKIAQILANKDYFENLETTVTTRSGDTRIILWNTKEIKQEGISRVIAVGLDVTEERKADAIRDSIINNTNVLIAVLGPKSEILIWNKAAESITGYAQSEVVGKRDIWKYLYPDPEYRRTITRRITTIISKNQYFENLETTITTKSGQERVISWNTRQIGEGGSYQAIAIGRDITGLKQAEEALIAYMLEMAMRIKQPVEIIRDNLTDVVGLIRQGKLSGDDIAMLLDGQIRNASQVAVNVSEFQKAIVEKNRQIPETFRKFLHGE
jgi:PAS domain S-box-containing protein